MLIVNWKKMKEKLSRLKEVDEKIQTSKYNPKPSVKTIQQEETWQPKPLSVPSAETR